jgi:predicted transcriptional regulator
MEPEKKTTRSVHLSIRLDPSIVEDLNDIANRLGIKPATIAGYAIGEYVSKAKVTHAAQSQMQRMMAEEMAKSLTAILSPVFDGKTPEELKELFKDD